METRAKLHPKLQIAVDRLNKRYANVVAKKYGVKECNMDRISEQGERLMDECITSLELYTDTSPKMFARIWVEDTYSRTFEHKFVIESRLIHNERRPRDEKRTTKDKAITKLIDEFARPFTLEERARDIASSGWECVSRLIWETRNNKEKCENHIVQVYFKDLIKVGMGEMTFDKTENFVERVNKFREAEERYLWIHSNTHNNEGAAIQVVAFQMGDRWVLNIFGGGGNKSSMVEFDSFDLMPDFIQEKIALLRIAPHNDLLEDIGVKVQENSYFLYGKELQNLNHGNDTGKESQGSSN